MTPKASMLWHTDSLLQLKLWQTFEFNDRQSHLSRTANEAAAMNA